jgi:hypothetical protein
VPFILLPLDLGHQQLGGYRLPIWPVWISFSVSPVFGELAAVPFFFFVSYAVCAAWTLGRQPGKVGACWLAGMLEAWVLASVHSREVGVAPTSSVLWWWFGRRSMVGILCRIWMNCAKVKPFLVWATTATSVDIVPFLKASFGAYLCPSTCSG